MLLTIVLYFDFACIYNILYAVNSTYIYLFECCSAFKRLKARAFYTKPSKYAIHFC